MRDHATRESRHLVGRYFQATTEESQRCESFALPWNAASSRRRSRPQPSAPARTQPQARGRLCEKDLAEFRRLSPPSQAYSEKNAASISGTRIADFAM